MARTNYHKLGSEISKGNDMVVMSMVVLFPGTHVMIISIVLGK